MSRKIAQGVSQTSAEAAVDALTGLAVDEAFIALFIAATDASGHISADRETALRALEVIRVKNSV